MFVLDWVLILQIVLFFLWFISVVYRNIFDAEKDNSLKYILIIVKNQENVIEGIIRRTLILLRKFAERGQIILIDMYSQDKTWKIISRMAYPKNNLSVYRLNTNENLQCLLDAFKNDSLVLDFRTFKY